MKLLKSIDMMLAKNNKPVEVYLTIRAFAWGIWLMLPFDTFQTLPAYNTMADLMPEFVWGIFGMVVGFFHLFGLIRNDTMFKRVGAFLAIFMWTFISIAFVVGDFTTTAVTNYPPTIGLAMWLFVRVGEQKHGR